MSLIKIVLSVLALVSTLLFLFSVYFVLGKKKTHVTQLSKPIPSLEKQEI